MTPADYLVAMRCPATLLPQEFGPWTIKRIQHVPLAARALGGTEFQTILYKLEAANLHLPPGTIVMDDSVLELRRHLPIVLQARGRVLVTGLGLGCVLRGLLANPAVTHVDIIEIDRKITKVMWPEFAGNPRATLHEADALTWPIPAGPMWDFAWHDIHAEDGLQALHGHLFVRFRNHARHQGAWAFPRQFKRRFATVIKLVGGQTRRRTAA